MVIRKDGKVKDTARHGQLNTGRLVRGKLVTAETEYANRILRGLGLAKPEKPETPAQRAKRLGIERPLQTLGEKATRRIDQAQPGLYTRARDYIAPYGYDPDQGGWYAEPSLTTVAVPHSNLWLDEDLDTTVGLETVETYDAETGETGTTDLQPRVAVRLGASEIARLPRRTTVTYTPVSDEDLKRYEELGVAAARATVQQWRESARAAHGFYADIPATPYEAPLSELSALARTLYRDLEPDFRPEKTVQIDWEMKPYWQAPRPTEVELAESQLAEWAKHSSDLAAASQVPEPAPIRLRRNQLPQPETRGPCPRLDGNWELDAPAARIAELWTEINTLGAELGGPDAFTEWQLRTRMLRRCYEVTTLYTNRGQHGSPEEDYGTWLAEMIRIASLELAPTEKERAPMTNEMHIITPAVLIRRINRALAKSGQRLIKQRDADYILVDGASIVAHYPDLAEFGKPYLKGWEVLEEER